MNESARNARLKIAVNGLLFNLYVLYMTDIIHSASKIFLHSNADNATSNGSSSSYTFQIEPLIIGSMDTSQFILGLEGASIPLSFYAINDTNRTFKIASTTYNIVKGNYSYTTLLTALNTLTGLVWKYNLDTNKLFVTTAVVFGTTSNAATQVLGYNEGDSYIASEDFDNVLNLTYTTGVTIRLDNISTTNKSADSVGGSSLLARLPITTPAYTILQFFNPQPFYTTIKNKVLTEISISLVDDDGELLNLNGTPNWFITLRIDYNVPTKLQLQQTNIQKMRDEALAPLQEQQAEDIANLDEAPPDNQPYVAPTENTNRIVKRDLVNEINQKNIAKQEQSQKVRPLRLQKKINRKIKKL